MTISNTKVILIHPKPMALHFTLNELQRSNTALKNGIDNTAPNEVKIELIKLASVMEVIRYLAGNKPLVVNSGYRCKELNTLVGGVKNSRHMLGKACDFYCAHKNKVEMTKILNDLKKAGLLRYWYEISPNNYHADIL